MHTQINPDEEVKKFSILFWSLMVPWIGNSSDKKFIFTQSTSLRPHLHFSYCDHAIEGQYPDIMFSILLPKSMCTPIMVSTAGGSPVMDQHPIQGGSRNTPSGFMPQKPGYAPPLMGHQARIQTLLFLWYCVVQNQSLQFIISQKIKRCMESKHDKGKEFLHTNGFTNFEHCNKIMNEHF